MKRNGTGPGLPFEGKDERRMTGAQIMVKCLEREGAAAVFGYPGAAICPFYDALSQSPLEHILVRQEQNAGHAASGYARASGKVGVVSVTSGPGATNLLTALATAYLDSIPLVAVTGQVSLESLGRDVFQEVDITGAAAPFIKHSYLVKSASELPDVFRKAFYIASTGRPGPVLIDVPVDVQQQEVPWREPDSPVDIRGYRPSVRGNALQIKKAAQAICEARQPLICAGGGVFLSRAGEEVRRLAEEAGIPVLSTMMGLGVFPTHDPLYLGMVGAYGGTAANRALRQADLLLVLGARVGDRAVTSPAYVESRVKIIHMDVDPAEIGKNLSTHIPVVGDLKTILRQLLELHPRADSLAWVQSLQMLRAQEELFPPADREGFVNPKRLMDAVSAAAEPDAAFAVDVGQHQIWAARWLILRENRFYTTGGLGTMGYALPAAMGIQRACPGKQVLAICGDGGFQMSSPELSTLAGEGLPVKILLLNNRLLGMVAELEQKEYGRQFAVQLPSAPDFCRLAEAYGLPAESIRENEGLLDAVRRLLSREGPALLECRISPEETCVPGR